MTRSICCRVLPHLGRCGTIVPHLEVGASSSASGVVVQLPDEDQAILFTPARTLPNLDNTRQLGNPSVRAVFSRELQ